MNRLQTTLLAQGERIKLDTEQLQGDFAGFDINFGPDWVTAAQVLAGIIAVIWVLYAIGKYAMPSGRGGGGGGLQKIGGGVPLLIAVICIAILVDINQTARIINIVVSFGAGLLSLIIGALPGGD